ncbi:hypothetical protein [Vibrio cholerae]|uniref:hypothetical protein n=1 Tax=Vibrio cholerae TaxID=666 RepID=UPI0004E2BDFD|nr:hypothetical protein [Vibrio cholerae]EGR1135377.1 hypothetical protein [Vibrio cholerae]KFE05417.1 hypothetical protein DN35_2113 [Vibrio cholerae]MCX9472469.1 hypothetical protein [Vibrio cholerae]MCX9491449.1 hypothetical protein [Vibrio cholerae]GHY05373.1 hypothetical protein VCSRO68_2320 [Vibrio cholerae]
MLDIQDIQSRKAREQTLHKAGVGTCALTWQVGFFFDGIHRNSHKDSESGRLSNTFRGLSMYMGFKKCFQKVFEELKKCVRGCCNA